MDAGLVKEICLRSTPWPITLLQEQHPESSHGMREQRELRDCLRSSLASYPLETTRNGLGIHTAAQELQKKSFQAGMAGVSFRALLDA